MKRIVQASLFLLLPFVAYAQTSSLKGKVLDRQTRSPLVGVYVKLTSQSDTTDIHMTSTENDGTFDLPNVGMHTYVLNVSCIGYATITRIVRVEKPIQNLGELLMTQAIIQLGEVVIQGILPTAVQKADTTEFLAKAFKTHPDADAGDLLEKMPGIVINNGTVTSNGETVQQILVDGKPFFGTDPTIALRSLPAEAIEKIQVFDKLSDQAEFTGFDDGQSVKTINIMLRPERRTSQFGKTYGGYGDDGRYLVGGNVNLLKDATRLSVIGLSNDINQQNFSAQDLLGVLNTTSRGGGAFAGGANGRRAGGGGGRSGGGGGGSGGGGGPQGGSASFGSGSTGSFLVGQQNGITETNSIGANYSDTWWKGFVVNQSYFFNAADNQNTQNVNRQYSASQDSVNLYTQNTNSDNKNYNHRFDSRIEYTVDSSNSIIDLPRLYFQSNRSTSVLTGANEIDPTQLINQAVNNTGASTSGNNLSNHFVYRHKFDMPGRTISVDLGIGHNEKTGSSNLLSLAEYYQGQGNLSDTVNQKSSLLANTSSLSARLVYTEPIGGFSLLQIAYNPSLTYSESENRKFEYDPLTQRYTIPDTGLSNTFNSTTTAQNAGLGYLLRWTGFNLMANVSYQVSWLRGDQTFPLSGSVDRTFYNVLPSFNMNYTISDHSNLRVFYRTSTRPPSISQLQNVVDNSNPLMLTTGNPDLKQSFNQTFVSRYSITSANNGRSFFLLFSAQRTDDYIGNSTLTAAHDTVLAGGVLMKAGTQLVLPVNLNGNWNASTFLTYSLPVSLFKSVFNLNSGLTYASTPGLVNQLENVANTYTISSGAVLSSNISQDVDFTLSYMGNYNMARNTIEPVLNSNYYNHIAGMKLNLIFWQGVVFRNEMSNTLYSGLSGGYNQNILLWNISLGKKFLANESAELRLTATDILNQNKSVNRTVTDTYVQDTQNRTLGQYVMLTFTYTMK